MEGVSPHHTPWKDTPGSSPLNSDADASEDGTPSRSSTCRATSGCPTYEHALCVRRFPSRAHFKSCRAALWERILELVTQPEAPPQGVATWPSEDELTSLSLQERSGGRLSMPHGGHEAPGTCVLGGETAPACCSRRASVRRSCRFPCRLGSTVAWTCLTDHS